MRVIAPATPGPATNPVSAASSPPGTISSASYASLAIGHATLATITAKFRSSATPAQLQQTFGPNWNATLAQYQVAGESCLYYLDSKVGSQLVYQLCLNSANVLANKTTISASASNGT